jgi:hypothetical protein
MQFVISEVSSELEQARGPNPQRLKEKEEKDKKKNQKEK